MKPNFSKTLDDPKWLSKNASELLSCLPKSWCCTCTIEKNAPGLAAALRPMGIKLRTSEDVAVLLDRLADYGLVEFREKTKIEAPHNGHAFFRVTPLGEKAELQISA